MPYRQGPVREKTDLGFKLVRMSRIRGEYEQRPGRKACELDGRKRNAGANGATDGGYLPGSQGISREEQ
jgi:hypothetical protein